MGWRFLAKLNIVLICFAALQSSNWLYVLLQQMCGFIWVYQGIKCLSQIRICIWLVLQCRAGDFFTLIAIVCSSWVPVNIATSKRSIAFATGNTSLSYVAEANCMCSRLLGGIWWHLSWAGNGVVSTPSSTQTHTHTHTGFRLSS